MLRSGTPGALPYPHATQESAPAPQKKIDADPGVSPHLEPANHHHHALDKSTLKHKVANMDPVQAAAELATIRTLMERAALYRRALAPMTLAVGALGTAAGILAGFAPITTTRGFAGVWFVAATVALVAAFLVVRRQALQAGEVVWTPPTRRVFAALAPSLCLGAVIAVPVFASHGTSTPSPIALAAAWMGLYGLGLNAAGFFMPRGIRWFGFGFAAAVGLLILWWSMMAALSNEVAVANGVMGLAFGLGHIAYGIYLRTTEQPASSGTGEGPPTPRRP